MSAPERRATVERPAESLSVRRQCALLNLSCSGVYRPGPVTGADDLALMRGIDELHLNQTFYDSRRMVFELNQGGRGFAGRKIGRQHVKMLMRRMGIEALYRRPRTTKPKPATRSIRICCAKSTSRDRTMSGSWTYASEARRDNTDQGSRSPVRPSPACWPTTLPLAWMAKAPGGTTSSLREFGRASNTRRSICEPYETVGEAPSLIGRYSTFTLAAVRIRALTTAPRIKPTSIFLRSARRPNPGRGSTYRRGKSVQTTGTTSHTARTILTSDLIK
jgi:hypothetical protein